MSDPDHPRVPIFVTADRQSLDGRLEPQSGVACILHPELGVVKVRVDDEWRPPTREDG